MSDMSDMNEGNELQMNVANLSLLEKVEKTLRKTPEDVKDWESHLRTSRQKYRQEMQQKILNWSVQTLEPFRYGYRVYILGIGLRWTVTQEGNRRPSEGSLQEPKLHNCLTVNEEDTCREGRRKMETVVIQWVIVIKKNHLLMMGVLLQKR
jgi:hypothetical protein